MKAKKISEYTFVWAIGGIGYYIIEILYRGFSHWSMFVVGGTVFLFCTYQGVEMKWTEPIWIQILRSTVFATSLEFITGIIVNKYLDLSVWDYTDQPFHLWGQICIPFIILFSGLISLAIPLGGMVAYRLFGEKKPNIFILK